jgi:hypothetical protein
MQDNCTFTAEYGYKLNGRLTFLNTIFSFAVRSLHYQITNNDFLISS